MVDSKQCSLANVAKLKEVFSIHWNQIYRLGNVFQHKHVTRECFCLSKLAVVRKSLHVWWFTVYVYKDVSTYLIRDSILHLLSPSDNSEILRPFKWTPLYFSTTGTGSAIPGGEDLELPEHFECLGRHLWSDAVPLGQTPRVVSLELHPPDQGWSCCPRKACWFGGSMSQHSIPSRNLFTTYVLGYICNKF